MRYLRQQVLNRRAPSDQRLYIDMTDSVVMNTTNNLVLPKGGDAARPVSPVVGMIRYNTDSNEVEVYEGAGTPQWRNVRYKEAVGITQQTLGYGDAITVHFGPLNPAPPTYIANNNTWTGANLLVYVENVQQLHSTNYTVVNGPTIPGTTYTPKTLGVTAIGAMTINFNPATTAPNVVYPAVDITGAIITGDPAFQASTAVLSYNTDVQGRLTSIVIDKPTISTTIADSTALTITDTTNVGTGSFLQFTSAVPLGKPVTVLHGFDK
jgi:hypothetical protein